MCQQNPPGVPRAPASKGPKNPNKPLDLTVPTGSMAFVAKRFRRSHVRAEIQPTKQCPKEILKRYRGKFGKTLAKEAKRARILMAANSVGPYDTTDFHMGLKLDLPKGVWAYSHTHKGVAAKEDRVIKSERKQTAAGLVESRTVTTPWWVCDAIADQTAERIFWITGGLGSGKTTGAAMWFLDRWLLNRNSRFSWGVAPTYTKVEQIIIPAVVQVLHDVYGLRERVHYSLTRTPFWKLVLRGYQHELHFLSGDRPELFVGSNIASWWITEPGLQTREVYEKCQTRLRCPRAIVRQGMGEGTPEGINWYADVADIPGVAHDRLDAARNFRRFIVETTMNRYLTPSPEVYAKTKIRDVYGYDQAKVQSYEKGLFTKFTKGSAYWEFVESRNVTAGYYTPSPDQPVMLSFDFNVAPLAWVAMQEFRHTPGPYAPRTHKIVALAESSGESRGLMDAVAEFAVEFPPMHYASTPILIYGDGSGYARNYHVAGSDYTSVQQYLQALGYHNVQVRAAKSNPQIKHRLEKTAALMAYEKFAVDVKCKRLIQSFVKTALREGTFEIEKPRGEDWTHYADACTYCLFQLAKEIKLEGLYDYTRPLGASL